MSTPSRITSKMNPSLKETNHLGSMLLNSSPMPILITQPDSSVIYVNKAAEKLTGFAASELIGTKVPYLFWPQDRQAEYLAEMEHDTFSKKEVLEKTFITKWGKEFWVEMTLIPVKINRQLKYIISTWINLTEEKKLRRELELYSQHMMKVMESERKRIADELHDDTAQSLAILSLELDSLSHSREIRDKEILERLEHLKEETNQAMQAIRQYSYELRPAMLEHLGLKAAVEQLVDDANERGKVEIRFEVIGKERELPNDIQIAFFRIAQEALSNIIRHSQATETTVSLKYSPQKVRLLIIDNGQGFDLDQERELALRGNNLGLVGMREWARLVQANLTIESTPHQGTKIIAEARIG